MMVFKGRRKEARRANSTIATYILCVRKNTIELNKIKEHPGMGANIKKLSKIFGIVSICIHNPIQILECDALII